MHSVLVRGHDVLIVPDSVTKIDLSESVLVIIIVVIMPIAVSACVNTFSFLFSIKIRQLMFDLLVVVSFLVVRVLILLTATIPLLFVHVFNVFLDVIASLGQNKSGGIVFLLLLFLVLVGVVQSDRAE